MTAPLVWITGAGRGIGQALARSFASSGARLVLTARSTDQLAATAAACRDLGASALVLPCDLTQADDIQNVSQRIAQEEGAVDILINNAGTMVFKPFLATRLEEFDAIHAVNLRAAFLCTQAVLPAMMERHSGMIVMINSMAAREVFRDSSVYAASKAGLRMMADCLRAEVRREGIRVLSVYPGATNTDIWPSRVREKFADRMMDPEALAELVLQAWRLPDSVVVEEFVIQPTSGPLS